MLELRAMRRGILDDISQDWMIRSNGLELVDELVVSLIGNLGLMIDPILPVMMPEVSRELLDLLVIHVGPSLLFGQRQYQRWLPMTSMARAVSFGIWMSAHSHA